MKVYALKAWHVSLLAHVCTVVVFLVITSMKVPTTQTIEVPIEIAGPREVQNLSRPQEKPQVVLKSVNAPIPSKNARQVFGASRNSYTDDSLADGVEIKKGNTLAKEVDSSVLKDTDEDSLPTPTEEYLVSEMPVVIAEIRPEYPKEAKEKQLEGAVALDILIDTKGIVRQVSVIEGQPIFLQPAIEAMKRFRFRPAQVDGKPVSVRIRYTLRFELEF